MPTTPQKALLSLAIVTDLLQGSRCGCERTSPLSALASPAMKRNACATVDEAGALQPCPPTTVDVVVVGAGISGLVAATALRKRDFTVAVLDARTRVGGRLLATPGGADLGGSWSWPRGEHRVARLAQDLQIRTVQQRVEGETLALDQGRAQKIGEVGDQVAPCGGGAIRFVGGYAEFPRKLADGAVILGARVTAISRGDANDATINVEYRQQATGLAANTTSAISARRVIVAVPPAVAAGGITWTPTVPVDQLRQMSRTATWAGDWAKVVATFKTPFWRTKGFSGVAATPATAQLPLTAWWEATGGSATGETSASLAGVGFGQNTVTLARTDTNEDAASAPRLKADVESILGALYGSETVSAELVSVHHAAWIGDELTYAPPPLGDSDSGKGDPRRLYGHPLLQRPLQWGVHFAGTETEAESGHVEGAIKAGKRAAAEVDAAMATSSV